MLSVVAICTFAVISFVYDVSLCCTQSPIRIKASDSGDSGKLCNLSDMEGDSNSIKRMASKVVEGSGNITPIKAQHMKAAGSGSCLLTLRTFREKLGRVAQARHPDIATTITVRFREIKGIE